MTRTKQGTHPSFSVLILVFFFWGFVAASNTIFIPFCKEHFNLKQIESQLIEFAFYGAYFIGAMVLYLWSSIRGVDILNKIGFKKGIIYGLLISVVGALALIGAVNLGEGMENKTTAFYLILGAFFIVALGFSLQQTAANPFAIVLGDPQTGANRLSLAGGVNSFGTTIGPLIVSSMLFGGSSDQAAVTTDVSKINLLYFFLSGLFLVAAGIFAISKMPKGTEEGTFEQSSKATRSLMLISLVFIIILLGIIFGKPLPYFIAGIIGILIILFASQASANKAPEGWGAMKYPQLIMGMIAIFVYVGAEVTVASNMGEILMEPGFLTESGLSGAEIDPYIAMYWGGLMIGRWTAAISVFNISVNKRKILSVIVPFLAYGVLLAVNHFKGNDISLLYPLFFCILIQIAGFFYANEHPIKTLLVFSFLATVATIIGISTSGIVATFAFISTGLFCSVMWPCIFALAIAGVGKYTGQASSFLIMMILGGALIPPVQGGIADIASIGIHLSYIIPVICFAYLVYFAISVNKILKSQGINYESSISGGH
jgi:FHS family L-fucose permease-like MFS transporter